MSDRCPLHDSFVEDIRELKVKAADHEGRISALERIGAGNDERFRTIFNVLEEIKTAIRDIAIKLEQLQQRPAHNWDRVVWAIISAAVTAGVIALLQKGAP